MGVKVGQTFLSATFIVLLPECRGRNGLRDLTMRHHLVSTTHALPGRPALGARPLGSAPSQSLLIEEESQKPSGSLSLSKGPRFGAFLTLRRPFDRLSARTSPLGPSPEGMGEVS